MLALIPVCLTQFVAFYLATRVLRRTKPDEAGAGTSAEDRRLALAAQTCAVFMIPVTGFVVIALAVLLIPWSQRQQALVQEAGVIAALHEVVEAETRWRQLDADGNGVQDYAVDNLYVMYAAKNAAGRAVELIPAALAQADHGFLGPARARAYRGYYFRTLAHDQDGTPYSARSRTSFGVTAWPERPRGLGRKMFIVNELGVVYEKEYGGTEPVEWPSRDPLSQGWKPCR